mgnify:FL=1
MVQSYMLTVLHAFIYTYGLSLRNGMKWSSRRNFVIGAMNLEDLYT